MRDFTGGTRTYDWTVSLLRHEPRNVSSDRKSVERSKGSQSWCEGFGSGAAASVEKGRADESGASLDMILGVDRDYSSLNKLYQKTKTA